MIQTDVFAAWLNGLRDREGRLRIVKRLRRLGDGGFGDCKSIGDGVHELRMFFGPGYRAYFTAQGATIILLLVGGDKGSQAGDIARAKVMIRDLRDGSEDQPL